MQGVFHTKHGIPRFEVEGKVMQCADCTRLLANYTKGLGKIVSVADTW